MSRLHIVDGEADTHEVAAYERSRRELLRRGLGLGGTAVAAASVPLLLGVRTAFAQSGSDNDIVTSAIRLENVAMLAYQAAIDSGLVTPGVTRTLIKIRDQESQHRDALIAAFSELGGRPPALSDDPGQIDVVLPGIGDLKSQRDVANFAIALEEMAVAAYYDAHSKLRTAALLQAGASIMANEGQHLTVLRTLVNQNPVPRAFEVGNAQARP